MHFSPEEQLFVTAIDRRIIENMSCGKREDFVTVRALNKTMVTMEDIACQLGLSRTTIWRVVNNKGFVSPKTRKRVEGFLEAHGYTKNLVAASLRKNLTNTIGAIFSDIENPFYAEALKGIERVCKDHGYNLIFCNTHENYKEEREAIQLLLEKRVDGLILIPVEGSEKNIPILSKLSIPVVFLARYLKGYRGSRVVFDDVNAGYIATSYLISRGHKVIAHIAGSPNTSCTNDRLEGYKKALQDHGIEFDPGLVRYTNSMMNSGKDATLKLLRERPDVTAIFGYSDFVAFGVIEALQELGKKIPDDIAIIGCDDTFVASLIGLTTIGFPKENMGILAARILLRQIQNLREGTGSNDIKVRISKPMLVKRRTA